MNVSLFTYWFTRKQRPHHLADALSRSAHEVTVFSTRSYANVFCRVHELAKNSSPQHAMRIRCILPSPKYDWIPMVPEYNAFQRRRLLKEFTAVQSDIHIFAGMPVEAPPRKPAKFIYDCMDDWSDYPNVPASAGISEKRLCEMADRIWVVSKSLYHKFEANYSNKLDYVPNGVEYEHFAGVPGIRSPQARPILGYVGAVYDWFDVSLVAAVACILSSWDIVLVGPISMKSDQLRGLDRPNIRLLGGKPYEDLPAIMATFDVAMIPFLLNDLIIGTSPIKLYEYLAAGLPVVATSMPEVLMFRDHGIVECADFPATFAQSVLRLKDTNTMLMSARRQNVARQHTWSARFDMALSAFLKR